MKSMPLTLDAFVAELHRTHDKGDVVAWTAKRLEWTPIRFGEFSKTLSRTRASLREWGLVSGDRLAICGETSVTWDIVQLAAALEGVCVLGLDPRQPASQRTKCLERFQARWICSDDRTILDELANTGPSRGLIRLEDKILAIHLERTPQNGPSLSRINTSDRRIVSTLTSGTTGDPKIVYYREEQLLLGVLEASQTLDFVGPESRTIAWMPMAHLYQRVTNLAMLYLGVPLYYCKDPSCLAQTIPVARPDFLIIVPKLLQGIVDSAPADAVSEHLRAALGPDLEFVLSGAAPLGRKMLDLLGAADIMAFEAYGVTENIVPVCMNRLGAHRPGSVGKPLPSNQVRLNQDGEIEVKGPGVFDDEAADTGESRAHHFTSDGFYRTGDIGRIDEEGFVYLQGRGSTYIKLANGKRVYPEPVETTYMRSPAIEQCFVFGHGRIHVRALIVPTSEIRKQPWQNQRELIEHEVKRTALDLAPYEQIKDFRILDQPFTVESGELTVSQKFRRPIIHARYRTLIDDLYKKSA